MFAREMQVGIARRAVLISRDSAGPHFPKGHLPKAARGAGLHLPKAARGRLIAPSRDGCLVAVLDLTATK